MTRRRCAVAVLAVLALLTGCSSTPGSSPASSTPPSTGAASGPLGPVRTIDLQAHRGGAGERSESTLPAFEHAMDLGVTTLELDTHITADRQVVINHDNDVNGQICSDTKPVRDGDPQYPYVGKLIKDLTLQQLSTLDCGTKVSPEHPDQQPTPGAKMITLDALFAAVAQRKDTEIRCNIEIKIDPDKLDESVPRQEFAQLLDARIRAAGMQQRVTIQSFDWESLTVMHGVDADLPLVALSSGYGGDLVAAARAIPGVTAISPKFTDLTSEVVSAAHAADLRVIPWTVDSESDMTAVLAMGVDGVITNQPTLLRQLLQRSGFPVPAAG